MPLSGVTENILDGQLGFVNASTGQNLAVVGVSSAGTVNTGKLYAGGQQLQLVADYGYGPGPQMVARILAKGFPCSFFKCAATTAGTCGAVTFVGTGTSIVTCSVATAFDTYIKLGILVQTGGTIGVAGISLQVTYDGGQTYGPVVRLGTANTYAIPNSGVTFAFAAGTLVAGDTAQTQTTEPKWVGSDLTTALAGLVASGLPWDFFQVVGSCNATEAAVIKTQLTSLETALRYTGSITETVRVTYPWSTANDATWQAALITDYLTFNSKRMCIGAGDVRTFSPIDQSIYFRNISWHAAEFAVRFDPARYELGRVRDDGVGTGAIDGSILDSFGNQVAHNEMTQPGLDSPAIAGIGFMTARTYPTRGRAVYITEAKIMAPQGSDFSTFRLRRDMDFGCASTADVLTNEIQETPPLNKNGTVAEVYAKFVEGECMTRVYDDLVATGRISDRLITVDRTNNVGTTRFLNVNVSLLPRGEVKWINETIGFAATLPTLP